MSKLKCKKQKILWRYTNRYDDYTSRSFLYLLFICIQGYVYNLFMNFTTRWIILLVVGSCLGTRLILQQIWPKQLTRQYFSTAESSLRRNTLHHLSIFRKMGSLPAKYSKIQAILEVYPTLPNSLSYCLCLYIDYFL